MLSSRRRNLAVLNRNGYSIDRAFSRKRCYHGRVNYHGHDKEHSGSSGDSPAQRVASLFEEAGWSVMTDAPAADFVVRKGGIVYVVQVKRISEGRTDRVVPLVSQSVLEGRAHSQKVPGAVPLVVVVGKHVPPRLIEHLKTFVKTYAPDVAIGFLDSHGLREFMGRGLETLGNATSRRIRSTSLAPKPVELFSDLNQWLLKVLLAADLADERLLNAPPRRYRNASELARGGRVSVMTAFRLVEQLKSQGFLHETADVLRLVRVDELLERWKSAAIRTGVSVGAKWLFAGDRNTQVMRVLRSADPEACVALFAAADAMGLGIARGVATHFYLRQPPDDLGETLGLIRVPDGSEAEVFVRIPIAKESVFRAAVTVNGIRACDVLQAWLDFSHDPSRGAEQGEHLYRRVIGPMIKRASQW